MENQSTSLPTVSRMSSDDSGCSARACHELIHPVRFHGPLFSSSRQRHNVAKTEKTACRCVDCSCDRITASSELPDRHRSASGSVLRAVVHRAHTAWGTGAAVFANPRIRIREGFRLVLVSDSADNGKHLGRTYASGIHPPEETTVLPAFRRGPADKGGDPVNDSCSTIRGGRAV